MILSAHQPAFIPWIGYFNKIVSCDTFIIMDDVQFEKNSFINRNQIQSNQGSNIWLTIPVQTKGYKDKTIKDIKIDNTTNWRKKHWETIWQNYKKSLYYLKYSYLFEELYSKEWYYLIDILNYQLNIFLNILDIKTTIIYLSDLNIKSKKQDLIKDMCISTNSNKFYFGSNGRSYADPQFFDQYNIDIKFQSIKQNTNTLSLLHLLFTEDLIDIKTQIHENFNFSGPSR